MTPSDLTILQLSVIQLQEIRKNYVNGLGLDLDVVESLIKGLTSVIEKQ